MKVIVMYLNTFQCIWPQVCMSINKHKSPNHPHQLILKTKTQQIQKILSYSQLMKLTDLSRQNVAMESCTTMINGKTPKSLIHGNLHQQYRLRLSGNFMQTGQCLLENAREPYKITSFLTNSPVFRIYSHVKNSK